MSRVFRLWDDCYDGDKKIDKDYSNLVFADLNFNLMGNPFYVKHRQTLDAVVFMSWNAWMDSNDWQSAGGLKSQCAWFLRDFVNEIGFLVAFLVRGSGYVREISGIVRDWHLQQLVKDGVDGFEGK